MCWGGGYSPRGSWSQSCRNWWRASIKLNRCRKGIANINGQLRCE
jgi:hypothetical protein